jgi:hypothetical protein
VGFIVFGVSFAKVTRAAVLAPQLHQPAWQDDSDGSLTISASSVGTSGSAVGAKLVDRIPVAVPLAAELDRRARLLVGETVTWPAH